MSPRSPYSLPVILIVAACLLSGAGAMASTGTAGAAATGLSPELFGAAYDGSDPPRAPARFRSHLLLALSIVAALFLVTFALLYFFLPPLAEARYVVGLVSAAVALGLFLLAPRATTLGLDWYHLVEPQHFLAAGFYDSVYVLALTVPFLVLVILFRRRPRAAQLVYLTYLSAAALSLVVSVLNSTIVPILGHPMTYQWFYFADFLRTVDAQAAISQNLSVLSVSLAVLAVVSLILFSRLTNAIAVRILQRSDASRYLIVGAVLLVLYFPWSWRHIETEGWGRPWVVNPVVVLVQSYAMSREEPELFTMETSFGAEEFMSRESAPLGPPDRARSRAAIRNVVVVVLESVGAQYLELYGATKVAMPKLARRREHAAIFTDIYAHAGSTNKAVVSLLTATYPWISYLGLTAEAPAIELDSLSAELKRHGLRTAFITSADNRYAGIGDFLSHRDFDTVLDLSSLECDREFRDVESEVLGGVSDRCVADAFVRWVEKNDGEPFFAMLWTFQTHYPYFSLTGDIDAGIEDEDFARYLSAMRDSDDAIARVLDHLDATGLSESTLVVVVGDHGESFGQHVHRGHGSSIYEENLRVPLVLIHPQLFDGSESSAIGGSVDVAPTILDLMDLPAPRSWQGGSLLRERRSDRVYFFSPWGDLLFGMRSGNEKLIYNATKNTYEVYDLENDPGETRDLSRQRADFIREGRERLAAWIQFHQQLESRLESAAR